MAIRLQDIADDLNLSKMTISKVLRGQTDVSAETKARVLKRVQELNYRPNISARSLRTGQTYMVGLVVPDLHDARIAPLYQGLSKVFHAANYAVVLSSAGGNEETAGHEAELHLSRQVDALFLLHSDEVVITSEVLDNTKTPVIHLGHKPARSAAPSVALRESEVGTLGCEHVVERGARKIAYLRGPRTPVGDQRFAGFLDTMRKHGLPVRQEWILERMPIRGEYQYVLEIASALLSQRNRPDAVLAYTDVQAAAVRDAALTLGIRVPEQLQVVGCCNTEVCLLGQPLTSIDMCMDEVGVRAARMALKMIGKDPDEPKSVLLSPRMEQRATTRALPVHAAGKGKKA